MRGGIFNHSSKLCWHIPNWRAVLLTLIDKKVTECMYFWDFLHKYWCTNFKALDISLLLIKHWILELLYLLGVLGLILGLLLLMWLLLLDLLIFVDLLFFIVLIVVGSFFLLCLLLLPSSFTLFFSPSASSSLIWWTNFHN